MEEANRSLLRSLRTGVGIALAGAIAVALAAPHILGTFTSDAAIVAGGTRLLWLGLLIEPGRVFNIVVIGSLRATGDAVFPVAMGAASMWLLWVPLAWVLSRHTPLGITGIWIAIVFDEWLRGLMMLARWRSRRWEAHARESRRIASEAEPAEAILEL